MADINDFARKVANRKSADDQGKAIDPQRYAVRSYSAEQEEHVKALPVFPLYQEPLQDPQTGEIYFTLDYDGLGGTPLA